MYLPAHHWADCLRLRSDQRPDWTPWKDSQKREGIMDGKKLPSVERLGADTYRSTRPDAPSPEESMTSWEKGEAGRPDAMPH